MRTEADTLEKLRGRLAEEAQAEGLIDVAYRTIDSPIGSLLLAATDQGLVRLAFANEDHDVVLESLASTVSPRILRTPARLDTAARELDQYFEGRRWRFDLPLDFRLSRGFRLSVLEHLVQIGFGATESYTEVAAAVGNPKAVRAAGTACATNPLPVIVPCHRVVRSDGSFGNYLGGVETKRYLLDFERRTAIAGSAR
ncbi:methylated-DNA--[protein]-cysteine S-methyltransferase [Smaragdicoccus niigatensis]|uniref:methylated-DNA--[protein]-cysteine S-methyltransferase n=1 Tax=Smaragdicoccus niigatensis TaxID=359359 RepID=UPI0003720084|nr:methylated-DNA--[protein]-cysteine S-methyltransferase [Smaragdicoccus niigatensis]